MGVPKWVERKIYVSSKKGGSFQGCHTSNSHLYNELFLDPQIFMLRHYFNDVKILVGA
jgi:hypothetical protein